ncbi:unnamed protein product [Protopolystoma xenopodis]|uniref:Uncharacterized protein n=1 Tax=Protopolystoma xenopodis TaxID=117903 RepID=A0A3S5CHI0_9PLAT|nr:unnamed protein product [Protopolystoma xenopodis]
MTDTAKLALTLHTERRQLETQHPTSNSDITSTVTSVRASASPVEFDLEARLLAQLRSSLGQVHSVFFDLSPAHQFSLIRASRQTIANAAVADGIFGRSRGVLHSRPPNIIRRFTASSRRSRRHTAMENRFDMCDKKLNECSTREFRGRAGAFKTDTIIRKVALSKPIESTGGDAKICPFVNTISCFSVYINYIMVKIRM